MVLIDIDMPKSCDLCTFCAIDERLEYYCNNNVADCYQCNVDDYVACRHPDCPLIEVPKGKWLEREVHETEDFYDIEEWQSAKCSVCGRYHTTPYLYYFQHYNYCPGCGAEMENV